MKTGEYGISYELVAVSPMSSNERVMLRNAKNEFNRQTGLRYSNREFRKHLLLQGAKRILTLEEETGSDKAGT